MKKKTKPVLTTTGSFTPKWLWTVKNMVLEMKVHLVSAVIQTTDLKVTGPFPSHKMTRYFCLICS